MTWRLTDLAVRLGMYGSQARKAHNMKKILLSLIPVGAVAGIVLSGLPASAATIHSGLPASAATINCSGDVCAQVTQGSFPGSETITAWAYDQTFAGYFIIDTSGDGSHKSPAQLSWTAGGPGYSITIGPNRGGFCSATAFALESQPNGNLYFAQIGAVSCS